MKCAVSALAVLGMSVAVYAHDFGNPPTWNREIARLVFDKCASCHREGGTAFSLLTYQEVQPRAVAIKEAVLTRRMPPWGAIKGFGEFRNDQGLSQEQIELISDWVEGGMRKGNNPNALPQPPRFEKSPSATMSTGGLEIRGESALKQALVVDGIVPERVADAQSMQIVAALPDGRVEPLLWLYEYRNKYRHPFLFRKPLPLPAGTVIKGLKPPATIRLLEAR